MGVIYKVTNLINNKIYIGQTKRDAKIRWGEHLSSSFNKNSISYNVIFHKAIRKYGKENFKLEIIEKCDNKILLDREKYWIKYFNSYENGYNSTPGGADWCFFIEPKKVLLSWQNGKNILEISKELGYSTTSISKCLLLLGIDKKLIKDRGYKSISKPISQYDLNGRYIQTFNSLKEAERYFGKNCDCGIRSSAVGKNQKTAFGFQWRYTNSKEDIKPVKFINGKAKEICQFNKNMDLIATYSSIAEAKRSIGKGDISSCLRGRTKTAGGYIWKYKEDEE